MTVMQHYYSNEFWKDSELHTSIHAKSQDELQAIAKQIRENCTCKKIDCGDGFTCTTYINENIGVTFYIKDRFGHISEIDEAREC